MTSPVELTAIEAPGWRGALPRTSTTVASANGCPPSHQGRSCGSRSRMGRHLPGLVAGATLAGCRDNGGDVLGGGKAVTAHEIVNVRKGRSFPGGDRFETGTAGARVG